MAQIYFPWMYVADPTKGRPVALGEVYFGLPDLDPSVPANQIQARAKLADGSLLNIPQPVLLNAGGVPTYNGSPIIIDVAEGEYSFLVRDALGAQVYYNENNIPFSFGTEQIADGAITTPKLGDYSVTTPKIADSAVTLEKLDPTVFDVFYPVGSIYMNADDSTNPGTLLGFGTWVAFAQGRVPLGVGEGTDENGLMKTFNQGDTGGEYTHTLTQSEMPSHTHTFTGIPHSHSIETRGNVGTSSTRTQSNDANQDVDTTTESTTAGGTNSSTGGGNAHNVEQPSIAVYIWRRTA